MINLTSFEYVLVVVVAFQIGFIFCNAVRIFVEDFREFVSEYIEKH